MGDLRDLDRFVRFARKDAWNQIKDNPARLLYGAVDPASTWAWNKVLGRDDKPLLNQLGSPMGSGDLGLSKSGGVYGRYEDQGGDARMGRNFFGIGDTIAGFYGGSALGGLLGGGEAAAGGVGSGASVGADASAVGIAGTDAAVAGGYSSAAGPTVAGEFASAGQSIGSPALQGTTNSMNLMQQGQGLLNQPTPQQQVQSPVQQQIQAPDPQAQQRRQLQVQQQMQLQALRQKPNKTVEEWQMLQRATKNQGLLA